MTGTAADAVAIVGAGCRFPGGVTGPDSFWRLLRDGTDVITEVPPSRWDLAQKILEKRGAIELLLRRLEARY